MESILAKRTQLAFIGIRLLGTPCWCLLNMLAFILYKSWHASPLQIAVLIALKPASSLLSPYWSQAIYQRPDKIGVNLLVANLLRFLPFLFVPWVHSPWLIILSFGLYMMLTRATVPAWMEMVKYHLPKEKQGRLVGYGTIIDFSMTAVLTLGMGFLLDAYHDVWKWLFSSSALLGLLSTWLLAPFCSSQTLFSFRKRSKLKDKIIEPWKQVGNLLLKRKDFMVFQIGFMLGGAGLIIMQPALPQLFVDTFNLSFVELGIAIALCKGVGVACTSSLWNKLFHKFSIYQLSALVTIFATLFPFLLLATSFHSIWLYTAYIFYGVMQGGSELSWHMSALVFSGEKDSSLFSTTNVLTCGIRGCFIPFLGSILLPFVHPLGVILLGAFLCLLASLHFLLFSKHIKTIPETL